MMTPYSKDAILPLTCGRGESGTEGCDLES